MKRRLLSMVMAFAMVLSLIPAVHAADAAGSDLIELLPGDETVKAVLVRLLDGGIPGNQDSIQEIRDLIDKEYHRPRSTAGYVVDENSYYVSLGDSTVTGMSTGDPAYNNFGYKTKVPTCAPYQVAQALGLDVNTRYEQLALGGLRTTDLRYILDETFVPDEYVFTNVKSSIDVYAAALKQMLTINVPVAELATYFLECGLYSYVTFIMDFKGACNKIHEIAPDAELLILGMYNPADNMVFTFDGMILPYGELYGLMVKTLSLQLRDYAEATPRTTFVDIYDTESLADRELEDGRVYELTEYVEIMNNNSGDFHATPAGHGYMKDQILAALAPEAEGLLGDADGSGEVDYLDAMIVLQYHTGVIATL